MCEPIHNSNSPLKSASILLVEDDQPILEGISDLLSVADIGYRLSVDTAQNGVEALECIQQRRPDLIISDIMMPRMDGYELLARVRENPDWVRIPFILATARGEKDDIHRGRTSGAQRSSPTDGTPPSRPIERITRCSLVGTPGSSKRTSQRPSS